MVIEVFRALTVLMSVSWLWYSAVVLQDVTIRGNEVKGTQGLCVTTACESLIISK